MNAHAHTEPVIETEQGKKPFRHPNPDNALEGVSFHEPRQPRSTVQPYVFDNRTFESFIGGAGI
jgi:hypothetical protein